MIVRLSARAEDDLEHHVDWLAEQSPRAAREAWTRIMHVLDLLEDYPELGVQTDRGWREKDADFGRYGYVVCYVIRETDILVVRIFHSAQNRD